MDEQRRFPRIPTRHAVLVKKLEGPPVEELAAAHTLGLGGCGFVSDEALGKGAHVDLMIPIDQQVVRTTARVVYERPLDKGFEIGVEFLSVDPENRPALEEMLARRTSP